MAAEVEVTRAQALAWRMSRQQLAPVGTAAAEDVVRRLTAVPAQSDVELAIRSRQQTSRPGEVAQAVADGRILRTFAFRGAVHLLTPEDGGTYLALRAAGRQWELPSWQEYYRLAPEDWPDFRTAVLEALDDHPLTPGELGAALAAGSRYGHLRPIFDADPWALLKALAWQGDLAFGPPRDGRPTFRPLSRNPRWAGVPELADAGPRAIEAYVRAYGPTTPDHLQYWLGAGLSAGRKRIQTWLDDLSGRLAPVVVDGTASFVLAEDVGELAGTGPTDTVRLLPAYDQWVLGPGTADPDVVPPAHRSLVSRGANIVVAGGVVVGTWSTSDDDLNLALFADVTRPASDALDEGIARLVSLLDRPLRTTVTVG
ncbi:DNA glycosylase AlkZ-like family protein [Cellulomonas fengjieae]|uniref:Winged helix DNA-binding domain-containing protein n=1 Tax=Cellulomonas fengjieae TaxID=2819978 RepID=A0ABS3SJK7_9CELL|nr:crosslink repair DNA glycosylase YcaQ family protein [Cellulomonas fengjieae]MBO3085932.1 winged helix DNA-binding domain-containing protein [Cellulomonas fengjieae]QVI65996.1 winged helix DNA-binding domain-containing protein [Cellulomonas fengjieae]